MQHKKENFLEFSRRAEALAEVKRVRLIDLPQVIGISKASFFAYRGGKSPISSKAWMRLERSEREAGITANDAHIFSEVGGKFEQITKDAIVEWVLGDADLTLKFMVHVATSSGFKDTLRQEIPKTVATLRSRREQGGQQQSQSQS